MKFITVNGGNKLSGKVRVDGMKNAALPVIFAAILTNDVCVIENIPDKSSLKNICVGSVSKSEQYNRMIRLFGF